MSAAAALITRTRARVGRVAAAADGVAAMVQKRMRRGVAEVVSVLCRHCKRWTAPKDWNPTYALCEVCTVRARHQLYH